MFYFTFFFFFRNSCIKNNSNRIDMHNVKSKALPLVPLLRAFMLTIFFNRHLYTLREILMQVQANIVLSPFQMESHNICILLFKFILKDKNIPVSEHQEMPHSFSNP